MIGQKAVSKKNKGIMKSTLSICLKFKVYNECIMSAMTCKCETQIFFKSEKCNTDQMKRQILDINKLKADNMGSRRNQDKI